MTNADKIKALSDEELAKLLAQDSCRTCAYSFDVCCHDQECIEGHEEWLKQEGVSE